MVIDDLVARIENSSSKKGSISDSLTIFGELFSNIFSDKSATPCSPDELNDYRFAIVYKYILDENKSDRQVFRNTSASQANIKAIDFISDLQKYLYRTCTNMVKDWREGTGYSNYSNDLFSELDLIRKKSTSSLAQSLSTRTNRYDSKMLITAIYDALDRGISVNYLGKLLSQHYSSEKKEHLRQGTPLYKQYIDRQKAIINCGK